MENTPPTKQEARIQQECFLWFNNSFCLPSHAHRSLIFHVPNENQYKLTGIGVLAGVSDLIAFYRGHVLFVEVKTTTGKPSPKQKEFENRVLALGHKYIIVRSLEDFKAFISHW